MERRRSAHGVLDLLDDLRIHPGEFIDRTNALSIRAMRTRAARVDARGQFVWFTIIFQYDADEQTIHAYDLISVYQDPEI